MLPNETKSRPIFLTSLCAGSAGFGVLWIIMLVVLITYSVKGSIPSGLFPGLVIEYLNAGYIFVLAEILLTGFGIAGIILMWQMKKTGFYLYAAMKTILYFLPVVFIGGNHLTFPGLVITSALIILYGTIFSGLFKK